MRHQRVVRGRREEQLTPVDRDRAGEREGERTRMRVSRCSRLLVLLVAIFAWLVPTGRAMAADKPADNEVPPGMAMPASETRPGDAPAPTPTPPEAKPKPKPKAPLTDPSTKRVSLETAFYTDSDHVTVFSPSVAASLENVTQGVSIHGSYLVDVVSAASIDIVSTASQRWHEVRNAGALEAEYKPHEFGVSIGGSGSAEPDYVSYGAGIAITQDLNEKNTTLLAGYGYSHDLAGRHGVDGPATPFSVYARALERGTFNAGVTQVIDRSTVLSVAADAVFENGDQSKPYRYIPMFAPNVAAQAPVGATIEWVNQNRLPERPLEQLPLSRQRFAVTGRLGHRFTSSTLRLEERLYDDSWELVASTTDARWIFDLGRRFALWPHARLNVQSAVNFWQRAYVSESTATATGASFNLPEFRTGDRELGPLRTVTGGGGARFFLGPNAEPDQWSLTFAADVMHSSYLNDLYLTNTTGTIMSLTFEGEL